MAPIGAFQRLEDGRGEQWDPDIVDVFLAAYAGTEEAEEAAEGLQGAISLRPTSSSRAGRSKARTSGRNLCCLRYDPSADESRSVSRQPQGPRARCPRRRSGCRPAAAGNPGSHVHGIHTRYVRRTATVPVGILHSFGRGRRPDALPYPQRGGVNRADTNSGPELDLPAANPAVPGDHAKARVGVLPRRSHPAGNLHHHR